MIRLVTCLLFVCLFVAPAVAADAKLEKGIPLPDGIPDAVKAQLSAAGYRVINETGAPYAEVWLTKSLAGEAKPANADVGYPGISDGSFLGVWRFVTSGSDYRGQAIKPGLYSMRYALMPQDANHMGAFPYRDFLLLVPLSGDQPPAATPKWDDVVALSKKASGTNHPATYPMMPVEGSTDGSLVKNDQGHFMLKAPATTKGGAALPVQFVVIGQTQG